MKLRWWFPAALSLIALVIIAATGCSKKDKSTSARDLTVEEQFATFEQFTGGVDTLGAISVPMIASSAGTKFCDGVKPYDTPDFGLEFLSFLNLGGFSRPGINGLVPGALGKRTTDGRGGIEGAISRSLIAAATQSGGYEYDATSGWWIATVDTSMSLDFDSLGTAMHLAIAVEVRDSVRFEASGSGLPSDQPNESTDRLLHGSRINLGIGFSLVSGDTINVNLKHLDLNMTGSNAILGLNGSTLTINGVSSFAAAVDLAATVPDTLPGNQLISASAKGSIGLTTDAAQVTMNNSLLPCPTAGTVHGHMALNLAANRNGESQRALGAWDMTITFIGGGDATVSVQSGLFTRDAAGHVCQP